MKKAVFTSCLLAVVIIIAFAAPPCVSADTSGIQIIEYQNVESIDKLPIWTPEQVKKLASWLDAKYHNKKTTFAPVPIGNDQVATLEGMTGVWFVSLQDNASLHTFQVRTQIGKTRFRYVFTFTLSPPVNDSSTDKFPTWAAAFNSNRLTQYEIDRINDADPSVIEQLVLHSAKGHFKRQRIILSLPSKK